MKLLLIDCCWNQPIFSGSLSISIIIVHFVVIHNAIIIHCSAIMYGKTIARVHLGHFVECWLAPSCHQLIGQAAKLDL